MRKVVVDQSVDKNNTSQVLSVTNDLLQGMTADYKECYLYTEKVVVRRMGGERFGYVTACGQRLRCWGEVTLVARVGILGTRRRKTKGSVVREKRSIVGQ
jgi:hypothetical protein